MLGKILLTLSIIIIAFFYVRQRDMKSKTETADKIHSKGDMAAKDQQAKDGSLSADLRLCAYMFLILVIGLGFALYYFQWQDDHSVLTVRLHGDGQAKTIQYRVYKYQLQDRSFVTLDGIHVTVASSERMEVEGL